MYGVRPEHMPEIIECTDLAGGLTEAAAKELSLVPGIPVFGGGGDTTFVNISAGCTRPATPTSMWEPPAGSPPSWTIRRST